MSCSYRMDRAVENACLDALVDVGCHSLRVSQYCPILRRPTFARHPRPAYSSPP